MTDDSLLRPGDFVKVLREAQRMWFEVLTIDGQTLTGRLDSTPATEIEWEPGVIRKLPIQPTLKKNDVITFDASEIMDAMRI